MERVKQLMTEEGLNPNDEVLAVSIAIIYIKAQRDLLKVQQEQHAI